MLLPGAWLERAVEVPEPQAPGTGGQEEACHAFPKRNQPGLGGDPGFPVDSGEVGAMAMIQQWVPC